MARTLAEVVNVPLSVHLCCCVFFSLSFSSYYVCSVNSITVCYLCFLFLKCLMLGGMLACINASLSFIFLIDCWWMSCLWLRWVAFVLYLGIVICVVVDQPCHIWLSCWILFYLCVYMYILALLIAVEVFVLLWVRVVEGLTLFVWLCAYNFSCGTL